MENPEEPNQPPVGRVISPGAAPAESIDLQALVQATVELALAAKQPIKTTPTNQLSAMVEQHIAELRADKEKLQGEISRLRYMEITHLRIDLRWLEDRHSALHVAYAHLRTSYDWVIAFNWFSFALIAIGGAFVSYAAFIPDILVADPSKAVPTPWYGTQKNLATFALTGLIIGVIIQAVISFRGSKAVFSVIDFTRIYDRPTPNPPASTG